MSDIDQQFIEYVVKSLVGKPDAVVVDRRIDEKGVLLELTVDPEDLGRVIGKRGATAQSLRTLLRALGTKNDARYNLKIIDNGVGGHGHSDGDDAAASPAPAQQAAPQDEPADTPAPTPMIEDEVMELPEATDETSDRLKAARAELADLDDLDV
jgi:predicted RNA-binding protein YlqC (UPF0109 family)